MSMMRVLVWLSLLWLKPCQSFAQWTKGTFPAATSTSTKTATSKTALPVASLASHPASCSSPLADDSNNNPEEQEECVKTKEILSLDSIRSTLIRQEETIIFALIERSQFRQNSIVYQKGGFPNLGTPAGIQYNEEDEEMSFLEYMLLGTEALHCGVRRYTSPEENPFFPDRLPPGPLEALPRLEYPEILSPEASSINFNPILLHKYVHTIVPSIARLGDDEQHGSTCLADVIVLQALSKRIHYGKFVAESKYRGDPETYQHLVDQNDADGVMEVLTNQAVERLVLRRAKLKAATYGREPLLLNAEGALKNAAGSSKKTSLVAAAAAAAAAAAVEAMEEDEETGKVDPAVIESVYRDIIIPLTKDVEVAYLFRRCGKEPPPEYAPDRMSIESGTTIRSH